MAAHDLPHGLANELGQIVRMIWGKSCAFQFERDIWLYTTYMWYVAKLIMLSDERQRRELRKLYDGLLSSF